MKKLIALFLFLVLISLAAFFLPRKLLIEKITCESQFGPCSQALEESLQPLSGKSITQTRAEIKNLLGGNAQVSEFSLQLSFPDSFEVKVVERKAQAALTIAGLGSFVIIDDDGTIINVVEKTALPIVVVGQITQNSVGSKVNKDYIFAASLVSELFRSYQVRVGEVTDKGFEAKVSGSKVTFPLEGDLDSLFGELALILSTQNPNFIDLRFQNPVVK